MEAAGEYSRFHSGVAAYYEPLTALTTLAGEASGLLSSGRDLLSLPPLHHVLFFAVVCFLTLFRGHDVAVVHYMVGRSDEHNIHLHHRCRWRDETTT